MACPCLVHNCRDRICDLQRTLNAVTKERDQALATTRSMHDALAYIQEKSIGASTAQAIEILPTIVKVCRDVLAHAPKPRQ